MTEIRRTAEAALIAGITCLAAQGAFAEGRSAEQIQQCLERLQGVTHETVDAVISEDENPRTHREQQAPKEEPISGGDEFAILPGKTRVQSPHSRRSEADNDEYGDPNIWVKSVKDTITPPVVIRRGNTYKA